LNLNNITYYFDSMRHNNTHDETVN